MTHTPDSTPAQGRPDPLDGDIALELERTVTEMLDVEPKARELSRRLDVLFGANPGSGWVAVGRDADGNPRLDIAPVALEAVLTLTRRLDEFMEEVRVMETPRPLPLGLNLPGGYLPTCHVRRGEVR